MTSREPIHMYFFRYMIIVTRSFIRVNETGNKKAIASKSVRQVKEYIKHHNDDLIPTLLWQRVK